MESVKTRSKVTYPAVELPHPLLDSTFMAFRNNGIYLVSVQFGSRNSVVFENMNSRLNRSLKRNGFEFYPTSHYATGYVIDPNQDVAFVLMDESEHGESRSVQMGCHGAVPRNFRGLELFSQEMGQLEAVINSVLDSSLRSFKGRNFFKSLPKVELYLCP